MRASIAIAAHNEGDLLWKTVQSCLETTQSLDCEIVVVDDGSTDGSVEELKRRFAEVQVLSFPERRGCPAAKHQSALLSKGDVLIFLDAHCKPEGRTLIRMVEDVEQWDGQVVIAPRIVPLDEKNWRRGPDSAYIGFRFELEWFRGGWVKPEDLRRCVGPDRRVYYEQSCMAGCSLALSRELYDKLRGFDQDMLSWGMEDQDFALKCWLMGHSMLVDTELVVAHRFVSEHTEYTIPFDHLLMNRIRLARRSFDREVWEDWCWRHRKYYGPKAWSAAWRLFERTRASAEIDREYFLRVRPHSVYQYAAQFDLAWPLTLASSPYSPPAVLKWPRYPTPYPSSDELVLARPGHWPSTTHVAPDLAAFTTSAAPDFQAFTTSKAPDFAAFTTSEAPDFQAFTTSKAPDFQAFTTSKAPDFQAFTTSEPPDFRTFTTSEPPDASAFTTSEPPDSGPGGGRQ